MAEVAAEAGLPIVVMHNQDGKAYARDIIETMKDFFRRTIEIADHAGVPRNHLILDPGISFGKTPEGNLTVLRRQQARASSARRWGFLSTSAWRRRARRVSSAS